MSSIIELRDDFTRFMLAYRFGLDEVMTKLTILRDEFKYARSYNPIEHVSSRLKSPDSILQKAHRKGIPLTLEDIKAQMFDDGQTPARLVAEATGQASVPYPSELAPDQLGADPAWLATLAPTGTHAGPIDAVVTTPGAPQGTRQRAVWPEVLWALALPLLILDLLLRRVAFGRARRGEIG